MPSPNVIAEFRRFVENGAGTYTAEVVLDSNDLLVDIQVIPEDEWTAVTSASLQIGDADDPDGLFTATNMKTQVVAKRLLDGGGAYLTSGELEEDKARGPRTITAEIVSVGAGTGGRTLLMVTRVQIPDAVIEVTQ